MKMRDGANFFINWMQLFHDFPHPCWMAFMDVGKLLEIQKNLGKEGSEGIGS